MNEINVVPTIYTPVEVAKLLQIKVSTLATWRYKGIGPLFTKHGRLVRYRSDHVNAYLDQQTHSSTK